jgi:hypothetical protein
MKKKECTRSCQSRRSFKLDKQKVYQKLEACLIDLPGWVWIEPHNMAEDGRAAYLAWTEHYDGAPPQLQS